MKDNGFADWWAIWPKNVTGGYQRKGGRSLCLQRWIKGCYWTQAETIIRHTEWMKTTADWIKDRGMYIPMPITYLNQQRWDGAEIDIPAPAKAYVDPVLRKMDEQAAKAVKPSAEVQARIAQLLGRRQ
jgi:hypothetical protein